MTAPALERCVGDPEGFLSEAWDRRYHLHRNPAEGFEDLLSLRDVDHILSSMSLRTPAFRLVKDGKPLSPGNYTKSGRTGSTTVTGIADPARIFRLFEEGATIVLQGMHRYWRPLTEFCRELELALGHPTQVNAYVTPPGSRGLAVHEDSHDVFVMQAFGTKAWEVWDRTDQGDGEKQPRGAPALSSVLQAGHCLYIPERTSHAARTQETVSGHLTVGVLASRWVEVLREALKEAEHEPALRERLPAGYHRHEAEFSMLAEERLVFVQRWLEKLDPKDVAARWTRRFLTTRPPMLAGCLEGLLTLHEIEDGTLLRRRRGSVCEITEQDGRLIVMLGDRELRMPTWIGPAMRGIAEREELRPSDLDTHLDPESRLVLIRRLVREGLLEVTPPG